MKLRLAAEINKMLQKPEQSTRAAYKRWRIAILTVGTILLHTIATVTTLDATAIAMATTVATMLTTVAATPSLNASTTDYLRRSIRVAHDGNVVIVCRTLYRSHTSFHEVLENKTIQPLNVTNEDLEPFAVLLLRGVKHNAIYRCMEREKVLSETILTIAASDLTSPEQIQIGSGDDAAFVFVRKGSSDINYTQPNFSTDYDDIRDQKIKLIHIDSDTHILLITNASAQKSVFAFTYEWGVKRSNECELDVGKAPESIKSFECTGGNYEYMSCKIIFPTNNLPTKYSITYKVEMPTGPNSCELEDTFDDKLGNSTKYIKLLSFGVDTCIYYPGEDIYNFTIIATNALGQFKNEYTIKYHEHVIPAELKVNLNDITSDSVRLDWSIALEYYYIDGLEYSISVEAVDFKKHFLISKSYSFTIELPYAYWNYTLYIKARNNNCIKCKWNKPTQLNFQTAQRRPQRAPHTIDGGFHINQKNITLYWEGLAAYERNGPNFTYVIQTLDMHGREHLNETKATSIDFPWSNTAKMYKVYAKNAVDVSPNVSIIQVPSKKLNPPLEIEQLYENKVYKLKWQHPQHYGNQVPSNYTVFWCRSPMNKCEQGTMHFTIVNNTLNEYPLPSESQQKMAIAANFPIGSSGLYWPTCSADLEEPLKKATIKVPNAISESSIFLEWSPENCRNAFDGYYITYCENATEPNCLSANETNSRSINYTLTKLKTSTSYSIRIQLYGKNNRTSPLSDVVYGKTNEAAPEPPTSLESNDITSHSAKISWKAPNVTNGVLRKYYIWYKNYNEEKANYIVVSSTKQSATITQLSSSAVYEVWLTAWTIKESNKSTSVNITTMIGIPKRPENVTLERDGGEYVLRWNAAKYSVEHMVFYELIFNDNNDHDILTVQGTSGQKHECRLKYRDCRDSVQNMQVRAVNVVAEKDLDKSAFAIDNENMQRRPRSADPAYNGSNIEKQTTTKVDISKNNGLPRKRLAEDNNKSAKNSAYKYKTYRDLECIQFEGIRTVLPPLNDTSYYMLKSEPESSQTNYNCSTFPLTILVASLIFISMFIATILWSYKVVRRQLRFDVKLPQTVLDVMTGDDKSSNDLQPDIISIVSSKTANGTALIHIGDTLVPSSGSESGVAGIGDGDTDTPSTSSEDIDRETLDSFSHSSRQQSPLRSNPELEQTKPTNQTGSTHTSEYISHAEAQLQSRPANNNNTNINNNNIAGNFYVKVDSLHKLPPIHATRNSFVNSLEQKYSQANSAAKLDKFAYVTPPSLLKAHTHAAVMRAGNNLSKNRLQEQLSQPETVPLTTEADNYVHMNTASDSFRLENEISRLPFLPTNSTHAQTNNLKNIAHTSSDYVLPDALNRVAPPHNATSAVNSDDTQMPLQQQIQYGYVTPEFWSQQNKRN